MQRIALFGGTFDPIHNGHLHSALELVQQYHLARVHMVPCYQPVHRVAPQLTAEQRFQMLQLACQPHSVLHADDRELRRQGPSYSIDTLQSLRDEYGNDAQLNLVMGADAFAQFDGWHRSDDFLDLANIVVMWRAGELPPNLVASDYSNAIKSHDDAIQCSRGALTSVQLTPWEISSTQIRASLAAGESVVQYLPEAVSKFVAEQQLYR
jgi:nicotinate-nucleotide adenylyltransferase